MKWPDRVQEIVNTLAAGVAHDAPDGIRRVTTLRIAEQCRFELGDNWGHKRADPGRPPSADVFCIKEPFVGWDWSVPGGVAVFPESIDLAGQVFIEVVPVNHLGAPQDDDDEEDGPDPLEPAVRALEARLEALESRLVQDEAAITEAFGQLNNWRSQVEKALGMLAAELDKPLKVTGSTGKTAFHVHSFSGEVTRG